MQDLREKLRLNLSANLSFRRNSWLFNALEHSNLNTTLLDYLASRRHSRSLLLEFEYFTPVMPAT